MSTDEDPLPSRVRRLAEQLDALERRVTRPSYQKVFVTGYARSGTTVITDILNSSPETLILNEFNYYLLRSYPSIPEIDGFSNPYEHFVHRKSQEIALPYKGAHIPPSVPFDTPLDELFERLGAHFRYVGDKAAISFKTYEGSVKEPEILSRFLADEEDACHFFVIRRPDENLTSAQTMFPNAARDEILHYMAATVAVIIRAYVRMPKAYIVYHEDLCSEVVDEFESILGASFPIPRNAIDTRFMRTRLDVPRPPDKPGSDGLQIMSYCYRYLRDIAESENTIIKRVKSNVSMGRLAQVVRLLENYAETEILDAGPGAKMM